LQIHPHGTPGVQPHCAGDERRRGAGHGAGAAGECNVDGHYGGGCRGDGSGGRGVVRAARARRRGPLGPGKFLDLCFARAVGLEF
jgi:hypothetical protein